MTEADPLLPHASGIFQVIELEARAPPGSVDPPGSEPLLCHQYKTILSRDAEPLSHASR